MCAKLSGVPSDQCGQKPVVVVLDSSDRAVCRRSVLVPACSFPWSVDLTQLPFLSLAAEHFDASVRRMVASSGFSFVFGSPRHVFPFSVDS